MAGDFLEAIGKLTVFVICAQILVYFRPKQVYEKYMRLLMNLLILLQLMLPIGNLLRGGSELDLRAKYESFQSRLEEYMEGTAWRVYDGWGDDKSAIPEKNAWEDRETLWGDFSETEQDVAESLEGLGMIERVEIPAVELGGKDER